MTKYQAYPKYNDSGVEWFGNVPKHWHPTRLKFLSDVNMGQSPASEDCNQEGIGLPFLQGNAEFGNKYPKPINYCVIPRKIAKKGELLFSVRAPVGALNKANQKYGIGRGLCSLLASEKLSNNFLWWLIPIVKSELDAVSTGSTFEAVSAEQVRNVCCFCPTFKEQEDISIFLDHETAKIDTLIEKQQQLIKLLKEKRQAVISHAVTKGLNPDAPMCDSGVDWLGEVPDHWIVRRLKHASDLQSGIPKGKDLTGKTSVDVPMLRVANVQDGYLDLNDVHEMAIEPEQLERYLLEYGDVLMNEGGDNDKLGRGSVWKSQIDPCIHQNHVFAIRPHSIEPEWLNLLTRSSYAKFHFFRVAKQSTNLASISSTNIKETPLVVPPENERLEIMEYVSKKLSVFEKVEEKCMAQVVLLQERRTALISAAVTGKIDVRNWQYPEQNQINKEDTP